MTGSRVPFQIDDSPVVLLSYPGDRIHLRGVEEAAQKLGVPVAWEGHQVNLPLRMPDGAWKGCRAFVHSESDPVHAGALAGRARAMGVPVVLQMDGVLEYANTFLNPGVKPGFLRPAPADVVLACGEHDASVLEALGNRAVATGLPRLEGFAERIGACRTEADPGCVLVATANQPWFSEPARRRLLGSLRAVGGHASDRGLRVLWRVPEAVAIELGVERDTADLAESLSRSSAVLTSASTLAFEAMLAERPVAVVHPHPWPLWLPCGLVLGLDSGEIDAEERDRLRAAERVSRAAVEAAERSIGSLFDGGVPERVQRVEDLFDALLSPSRSLVRGQSRILERCVRLEASRRVADVLAGYPERRSDERAVDRYGVLKSEASPSFVEAFDRLRALGIMRIAVALPTFAYTPEVSWLAEARPAGFVGFVAWGTFRDGSLFGVPAVGHTEVDGLGADVVLVAPHSHRLSIASAIEWNRSDLPPLVVPDGEESRLDAARHMASVLRGSMQDGEVRTNTPAGWFEGLTAVGADGLAVGDRPGAVLLSGTDEDYARYRELRAWREAGTVVTSLLWSDEELSGPERLEAMVEAAGEYRYALYGGGGFTERLLRHATLGTGPVAILDDRAGAGQTLGGVPVHTPEHAGGLDLGLVVISSPRHEQTLWERSAPMRARGIRVERMYAENACRG